MSTTIIASLLVGAVLSLRFKVLILVPTIIAAWAVLTGIGLVWEIPAAWVVLEIVVVTTALYQPSDWVTLGGFPNRR